MKIFYVGCVVFSKELLEAIINNPRITIVGVATKESSNFNTYHYDLSKICGPLNIPFKYIRDINNSININWIDSLKPEIIFCLA